MPWSLNVDYRNSAPAGENTNRSGCPNTYT